MVVSMAAVTVAIGLVAESSVSTSCSAGGEITADVASPAPPFADATAGAGISLRPGTTGFEVVESGLAQARRATNAMPAKK